MPDLAYTFVKESTVVDQIGDHCVFNWEFPASNWANRLLASVTTLSFFFISKRVIK